MQTTLKIYHSLPPFNHHPSHFPTFPSSTNKTFRVTSHTSAKTALLLSQSDYPWSIFEILFAYNNFAMEEPEELNYQIYKEYEILEKLGKGTYGVVFRGRHKKTGKVVAIKKIIDAFQNLIDAKRTYRELNYLLQLDHPCVVRLDHLLHLRKGQQNEPNTSRKVDWLAPPDPRGATTDKLTFPAAQGKHVYAVFQCLDTDLAFALQKCKGMQKSEGLQPIQRKFLAYQLLHGLAYLHRSGLVHRDIKPSNLLLNLTELQLKICDFGMARLKVEGEGGFQGVLTDYVASRQYRPPQALLGITTCAESIDLWSAGCVLAQLVLLSPLFPGRSTLNQLQLILKMIGMPSAKEIDRLPSQNAKIILKDINLTRLKKVRTLQQSLSQCSQAELEIITGLLRFDPQSRISAEQALKHEYFSQVRNMNPLIQKMAYHTTKILDFSLEDNIKQLEGKGNSNLTIDHYRMLIDELQKFAQRSMDRSGNNFNNTNKTNLQQYPLSKYEQRINIDPNFDKNASNHEPFKQKSTKESDFVAINKHHYLSSTHSLIHDKGCTKVTKQEEKTKTVVDEGKMKKMKKKTILRADIQRPCERSQKAINPKKQIKKQKNHNQKSTKLQVKQRKALTVAKKNESLHKSSSTKMMKQRAQSANDKKIMMLYTQPLPKKRNSEQKDSKSLISNKSSSSLYRHSNPKTPNKPYHQPSTKLKLDTQVKRFMKPALNLNKSAILKCKSPKFSTQFKKST